MTRGRLARAGAALALAGLALAACTSSRPSLGAPAVTSSSALAPDASTTLAPLSTFPLVLLRIRKPDGSVHEVCVYLADTPERQAQGLMGLTDIGPPAGMLFEFPVETSDRFYMFSTLIPLSIAFFDRQGAFVSTTDMPPCTAREPGNCPTYAASAPYRWALEVPEGELPGIGVARGTVVQRLAVPCATP